MEGIDDELSRLEGVVAHLKQLDEASPPPPRTVASGDYAYDLLLELQRRRRAALAYEIGRLKALVVVSPGPDEL